MTENPFEVLSLGDASDRIRAREVKVQQVVQTMLDRVERLNPHLNAFVAVMADSARVQARELDSELDAGHWRGPLHGNTVGVKDLIEVGGVATRAGRRSTGSNVPTQDSTCVSRLRSAGAVILGKLHTHELAGGATSESELYGRARNPWNADYIPGGSSGGSAIATSAALVHAALGTDTGGSVRMPAAFCGVVGLKGTFGAVSRTGVLTRSWTMDHVGAFARRVRDATLIYEAMAGHDPNDPYSSPRDPPRLSGRITNPVAGMRAGIVCGEFFEANLDPEIGDAFQRAVEVLQKLGLRTTPARFELAAASHAAGTLITIAEADSSQDEKLREAPDQFGADIREQLRLAEFISARQYLRALRARYKVQQELEAVFQHVDVLVTPTTSALPTRSDGTTSAESLVLFARNTRPFSMPGLPAISVPAGFSANGLPIGLQVIAPPFHEAQMLRVAHAFENATSWHERLPDIAIKDRLAAASACV
jgi:aspartyl-tRNA(Asn)/glutamyl-tRNA(Gln) amidotransferase subunit A